jgi:nicotinate-nucleotide pyrophosphorylase (carboxylating)
MRDLIRQALDEDLGQGDLTSRAVVPEGSSAHGVVIAKDEGVLAGIDVAAATFAAVDGRLSVDVRAADGDSVGPGGELMTVRGDARAILAAERVALNLLGRLSGVATLTARYVAAIEGTGTRILDTRKTTPGLRALEKAAVVAGGGTSHRFGLYDAILVKENHATLAGGVAIAARLAVEAGRNGVPVEVECATLDDVAGALDAGVPRLLLDNMSPEELRTAVGLTAGRAELEASGGITLDTVRAVAETGVDFISVGALTHSAPALDFSLLLDPLE